MAGNNIVKFLITGDASQFTKATKEATDGLDKTAKSTDSGKKALSALNLGTIAAGAAVVGFGKKSVDAYISAGKETMKLQRLTGGTAEQMSGLRFVAQQTGVDFNTLAGSATKFSKSLDTAKVQEALKGLGVSSKDAEGNTRPYLDILKDVSTQIKSMPDGIAKTRAEQDLFGKSGANLGPLLNQGADGIDKLISKGKDLGVVFSNTDDISKQVKAQRDLQATIQGLEIQVGKVLIPVLTDATGVVTKVVGAFTKLPGPIKSVVEVGGGLAVVGFGISKAWGVLEPVIGGVSSAFEVLAGQASNAISAVSASSDVASLGLSSIAEAAEFAASGTVEGMTDADASVAALGSTFQSTADTVVSASDASKLAIEAFGRANAAAITPIAGLEVAASRASKVTIDGMSEADAAVAALGLTSQESFGKVEKSAVQSEGAAGGLVGAFTDLGGGGKLAAVGIVAAIGALIAFKAVSGSVKDSINETNIAKAFDPTKAGAFQKQVKSLVGTLDELQKRGKGNFGDELSDGFDQLNDTVSKLAKTSPEAARKLVDAVEEGFGKRQQATIADAKNGIGEFVEAMSIDPSDAKKGFAEIRKSIDDTAGASRGASTVQEQYGDAFGKGKKGADDLSASLGINTDKTQDNAAAADKAAQKWTDYGTTMHGITDPLFGAISAQDKLVESQQAVFFATVAQKKALDEFGKNSPEYAQATKDLTDANKDNLSSVVDQQSALSDLLAEFGKSPDAINQAKGVLQGWVSQGLITQDTANGIIFQFGIMKAKADALNGTSIAIQAQFDDYQANVKIDNLIKRLAGLSGPGKLLGFDIGGTSKPASYQPAPKGSKRAGGGPTQRDRFYEVTEQGSELLEENGRLYLLAGANGKVIPNHALTQQFAKPLTPTTVATPRGLGSRPDINLKPGTDARQLTDLMRQFNLASPLVGRFGSTFHKPIKGNVDPVSKPLTPVAPRSPISALPDAHGGSSGGNCCGGDVYNFEAGSIVLQAAPGEDPYQFGKKAIKGIQAVAAQNGAPALRQALGV